LTEKEKKLIDKEVGDVLDYLEKNTDSSLEDLAKKHDRLTNIVKPVLERAEALDKLDSYANDSMQSVLDKDRLGNQISSKEKNRIVEECTKALDWVDQNPNAKIEDIRQTHKELESKIKDSLESAQGRKDFDERINNLKNRMENDEKLLAKLSKSEKRLIDDEIKEALEWLKDNEDSKKIDVDKRGNKFDEKVNPIVERIDAFILLEEKANKIKKRIDDPNDLEKKLDRNEKKMVEKETNNLLDWLDSNPNASKQKIDKKSEQFDEKVYPIIDKAEEKAELQEMLNDTSNKLKNDKALLSCISEEDKKKIEKKLKETQNWFDKSADDSSLEQLREKKEDFQNEVLPIMKKAENQKELKDSATKMKQRLKDDKDLLGMISNDDRRKLIEATREALDWLDANPDATKKEVDQKKNEFDGIINPILTHASRRKELRDFANEMKEKIKKDPKIEKLLSSEQKDIIEKKSDELINWIDKNPNATSKEIYDKKEELREIIEPMLERARAQEKINNYLDELELRINDEDGDLHNDLTKESQNTVKNEINKIKNEIKQNPLLSKKELETKHNDLSKLVEKELLKSKDEIELLKQIEEQEKKKKKDREELNKIKNRHLGTDLEKIEKEKEVEKKLEKDSLNIIEKMAKDLLNWIDKNSDANSDEIDSKENEFKSNVEKEDKKKKFKRDIICDLNNLRNRLNNDDESISNISENDKKKINEAIKEFEDWLKENPNATEEEIEKQKKKLDEKINPLLQKGDSRRRLENLIGDLRRRNEDDNDELSKLSEDDKKKLLDIVKDFEEWLKKNPNASEKEINEKYKELLKKSDPFTNKSKKRRDLIDEVNKLRNNVVDKDGLSDYLSDEEKKKILDLSKEFLQWLEQNPDASEKEIEKKKRELDDKISEIVEAAQLKKDFDQKINNLNDKLKDENFNKNLSEVEKKQLNDQINESSKWLNDNPDSSKSDTTKRMKSFDENTKDIISKAEKQSEIKNKAKDLLKKLNDSNEPLSSLTPKEKKIIESECKEVLDELKNNDKKKRGNI
jgi:hypothetical protein